MDQAKWEPVDDDDNEIRPAVGSRRSSRSRAGRGNDDGGDEWEKQGSSSESAPRKVGYLFLRMYIRFIVLILFVRYLYWLNDA